MNKVDEMPFWWLTVFFVIKIAFLHYQTKLNPPFLHNEMPEQNEYDSCFPFVTWVGVLDFSIL